MIENIDYVICPICNEKIKRISTNGHLRKHNITFTEFKCRFPTAKTYCKNYSDKLSISKKKQKVSKETRSKISKANRGNKAWNKGKTKLTDNRIKKYGKNVSKTRLRKLESGEMIHNSLGQKRSFQYKKKMRLLRVSQLLKNGNKWPAYNKKACDIFKLFDIKNNTNGQYATHPYEYLIRNLGYWVDYINFDMKLIIEVDEPYHFNKKTGKIREKDIQRQKEIQELFSDYTFLRFKDKQMDKILEIQL